MNSTRQSVCVAALLLFALFAVNPFFIFNPLCDIRNKVERYVDRHFGWITAVKLVKPPLESLQCISLPDHYSVMLKKGYSHETHKSKVASAVDLNQATYVSYEADWGFNYAAILNNAALRAVYDEDGVEYIECDHAVVLDEFEANQLRNQKHDERSA